MNDSQRYYVVLFGSVSHTLLAEKILKQEGIPHKLIPVPRHISSDCGVCIRFMPGVRDEIEKAIAGRVTFDSICAV
ncbi:MAG TPA: DUF3343 domain-containing protein [Desulfobacterales bacterium]|nr:DUF3343 domain-containing protein [Desulfobacterales bacterium]